MFIFAIYFRNGSLNFKIIDSLKSFFYPNKFYFKFLFEKFWIDQIFKPYSVSVVSVFVTVTYPKFETAYLFVTFACFCCCIKKFMVWHDYICASINSQVYLLSSFLERFYFGKQNLRCNHYTLSDK